MRDLASALAYAHDHRVIHRDIKPENILLDAETGRAMIADFGVAQAISGSGDERLTGTGLAVGSPRYMSPEQAAGERQLDGRTDIYSLGLVGYELFTGGPAFTGSSAVSIITKQITEKPVPLAVKESSVPAAVAEVIDRALEKDPANRWQNASEMVSAFDAASIARSDSARIAHRAPGGSLAWRKRYGLAALGVAVVIGLPLVWWLAQGRSDVPRGVDPRKSFLVAPFENQTGDPSLGWLHEGSVNMLTLNLSAWSDLHVVDYEQSLDLLRDAGLDEARRIGLEDARKLARKAGAWTVVMGQITRGSDSLRVTARVYDVASGKALQPRVVSAPTAADPRGLFDRLSRELLDLAGAPPMSPELAKSTTTSLEAYRAYLTGVRALNAWNLPVADSALEHAIRADSTFALAYYKRALLRGWNKKGFSDTSDMPAARLAARYGTRLPARERGLVDAYLAVTQGVNSTLRGDTAAAAQHLRAAQSRYSALLSRDSTDAEAWYGLADAYFHMPVVPGEALVTNWTRSLRAFNRTLALDSSFHLAYPHKLTIFATAASQTAGIALFGDSLVNISTPQLAEKVGREKIVEARRIAREHAIRDARHWVEIDPDAPEAHHALADAYVAANDPIAAANALRQTMRNASTRAPEIPYRIAALELAGGRPAEALTTLREAMRTYGSDSLLKYGGLRHFPIIAGSGAVASHAGAIDDFVAVFKLLERIVPELPGAGGPNTMLPTRNFTRIATAINLLAMGVPFPKVKRDMDASLREFAAFGDQSPGQARQIAFLISYYAYGLGRDTTYLAQLRKASGGTGFQLAPAFQARDALERGDTAGAEKIAAQFARGDTTKMRSPGPQMLLNPYVEAEVLEALGDLAGAAASYSAIDPLREGYRTNTFPDPRWPLYARSYLARAQVYEKLGDRGKAEAAYTKFLDLWKDADPALAAQLDAARNGLARLRDAPQPVIRN